MSDKKGVPSMTMVLDKPYELKFGFSAQRRHRERLGESIEQAVAKNGGFTTEVTANALWIMLLDHNPEIKREDVDDLLDQYFGGCVTTAIGQISDIVSLSLNGKTIEQLAAEEKDQKNALKPQNP